MLYILLELVLYNTSIGTIPLIDIIDYSFLVFTLAISAASFYSIRSKVSKELKEGINILIKSLTISYNSKGYN